MSSNETTTMSPLDLIMSSISIPSIVTQIYLWAYLVSFIIGFTGNIFSLLTFSRSTLRNISTCCLFIILAISDTIFLLVRIIDFVEYGLQIRFYHRIDYDVLCQFRVFTSGVAQLFSAWILVLITADRWIRTKFPFKANSVCTPKNALIVANILLLLTMSLNSHLLTSYYGMTYPDIPQLNCGPNTRKYEYAVFFVYQWAIIQIFTTSVLPTVIMFVLIIHMIVMIRTQKNTVLPHTQSINTPQTQKQDRRNQNQMFILMISNATIFFLTTLPLTMSYTISTHTALSIYNVSRSLIAITILNWIQQLNCCINFYIRCLTSTLFRKEFFKLLGIKSNQGGINLLVEKTARSVSKAIKRIPN